MVKLNYLKACGNNDICHIYSKKSTISVYQFRLIKPLDGRPPYMFAPELARSWREWWAYGAARNFKAGDKGQKFFLNLHFTVLVGVTKTWNTRAPLIN